MICIFISNKGLFLSNFHNSIQSIINFDELDLFNFLKFENILFVSLQYFTESLINYYNII